MTGFEMRDGVLHSDGVSLEEIARAVGTPAFVYSADLMTKRYRTLESALEGLDVEICYAMKANSNQAVLRHFVSMGAGLDVVSEGELSRALAAGVDPKKVVFAGVGKTPREIEAGLAAGIRQFNVESPSELAMIDEIARARGVAAPVSIRINPDVDAKTHAKITTGTKENKFGIDIDLAPGVFRDAAARAGIQVVGVATHIGSQILDLSSFRHAYSRLADLVRALENEGIAIAEVDLGGGVGIDYEADSDPDFHLYADIVRETVGGLGKPMVVEPGRSMVGDAGVLLTHVVHVKRGVAKTFAIVDGAMNDLIRPTLYEAYHDVVPVRLDAADQETVTVDIVGPVCESGDYLAQGRAMPVPQSGDLLAVKSAGAYGAVMASVYNSRPQAAEVLTHDGTFDVVRPRDRIEQLIERDRVPGWLQAS
ncbi:MAG: diaminopimelate decarboxylase [Alphaproteobacteria bacterium]|nr:diaminopimelate decarboxylase [Alphaproteobacteria bacterium]